MLSNGFIHFFFVLQIPCNFYVCTHSVNTGIRYAKRGELAAAVRQFNRALDLDQKNVEAFLARGALYANREDFSKAIENFEKALAIDSENQEAKNYLYESLVGQALTFSRDRCYESARRSLQKAGEIVPEKRTEIENIAKRCVVSLFILQPSLLIDLLLHCCYDFWFNVVSFYDRVPVLISTDRRLSE